MKVPVPLFLIIFLGAARLFAEEPQQPPHSSEADVIDQRAFEESRSEVLKTKRKKKPLIKKAPEPEKPKAEGELKFFVREIVLQGSRLIPPEELRPFLKPFEGRELTLTEANRLAKLLQQEHRRRGYITTLVFVPPQRVESGRLTLTVLEGKFGKLYIEGSRWFSDQAVRRYWTLREGEPLQYEELQKSLRRINGNPDRQAQIVLRPGKEAAATDVYLKIKDKFPGHGRFQYDNQGSKTTGRRRYGFMARYNNALIPDSIFLIGTVFGKDFGAIYAQYLVPLTSFGTQAIFGFSHSQAAPKREFKGSDVHGDSSSYSISLRQALMQTDRLAANLSFGFDFKESRSRDVSGVRRRERLRVLRPAADLTEYDSKGYTLLSNQFGFGLNGLGASGEGNPLSGRVSADPSFVKYTGSISRILRMPFGSRTSFKLDYQVSLDKLLSQEEFYLGGAGTVRGYPEGDYLADQAVLFSFEYLFPIPLPFWKIPALEGVVFFDEGYGRLRGASAAEFKKRHLMGLGGGLRIRLKEYLSARVEIGHAIGQEPLTESDHTRLHFQLQMEV